MPDLIGIRVKCPECGATTQARGDIVTCSYCGTECRVQRRTQVLQRPIVLPPVGPMQPQRIAVQSRSNTGVWLVFGAIMALTTIVGIVWMMQLEHTVRTKTSAAMQAEVPTVLWSTARPLLGDLDHDGVEDVIGIARYIGNRDEMRIRALAGSTGKTLWESPSLGTYIDTYRSTLVLAGGLVLFADLELKPRLDAYDAATGAKKWTIVPGEVVEMLCRDRDGFAKLVTKDEVAVSVELATGATTAVTNKAKCDPLPSTTWIRSSMVDTNNKHWRFSPPGMASDQIAGDASSWIIIGHKAPGSPIPMIAVIDDHEHVRWKTQLASTDPMSSKSLIDQTVAYDETIIATVYARTDERQPAVLVAFDRARGTRLFETALPINDTMMFTSIAMDLGATTIWIQLGTGLQAYDRKTGALRWTLQP